MNSQYNHLHNYLKFFYFNSSERISIKTLTKLYLINSVLCRLSCQELSWKNQVPQIMGNVPCPGTHFSGCVKRTSEHFFTTSRNTSLYLLLNWISSFLILQLMCRSVISCLDVFLYSVLVHLESHISLNSFLIDKLVLVLSHPLTYTPELLSPLTCFFVE